MSETNKRKYDSTVARIAGNILSGYRGGSDEEEGDMVAFAVNLARAIVAETERTEPAAQFTTSAEKETRPYFLLRQIEPYTSCPHCVITSDVWQPCPRHADSDAPRAVRDR